MYRTSSSSSQSGLYDEPADPGEAEVSPGSCLALGVLVVMIIAQALPLL